MIQGKNVLGLNLILDLDEFLQGQALNANQSNGKDYPKKGKKTIPDKTKQVVNKLKTTSKDTNSSVRVKCNADKMNGSRSEESRQINGKECPENSKEVETKEVLKKLKQIVKDTDPSVRVKCDVDDKKESRSRDESSSILRIRFKAIFDDERTLDFFKKFLLKLAKQPGMQKVYMTVEAENEDCIFNLKDFNLKMGAADQESLIKSFQLGSIIGVGNFVSFFDSALIKSSKLLFEDTRVMFMNDREQVRIKFYTRSPQEEIDEATRFVGKGYSDSPIHFGDYYELRVMHDTIHSVIMTPSEEILETFLVLKCPPLLYRRPCFKNKDSNWIRVGGFPLDGKARQMDGYSPFKEPVFTPNDFGKCNVMSFRMTDFSLRRNETPYPVYTRCPWEVLSNFKRFLDLSTPIPFYVASLKVFVQEMVLQNFSSLSAINRDAKDNEVKLYNYLLDDKNFDLLWSVLCCHHFSHQFVADLTLGMKAGNNKQSNNNWNSFWKDVLTKWKKNPLATEKTFYDIFHCFENNLLIRVAKVFEEKYEYNCKHPRIVLDNMIKMRRAVLTPTRLIIVPPHYYAPSRFFSKKNSENGFQVDPSLGLRIIIRDDDGKPLVFNLGAGSDRVDQLRFIQKHVKDVIYPGISIGPNRKYELLTSTSSQMRENGVILLTKGPDGKSAKELRNSIGVLSGIRSPGKYIARSGQAFSQMQTSVDIKEFIPIPDIKGGMRNSIILSFRDDGKTPLPAFIQSVVDKGTKIYNFTDGIGKVSIPLAEIFREKLKLNFSPSAFQIRYKGYKGVVAVDPEFYPEKEMIGLRPSMDKFPSQHNSLEILKYSKPRPVRLNAPLITILDQLKTNEDALMDLLNSRLHSLSNSIHWESAAPLFIEASSSFLYQLLGMNDLSASGINFLSEPFFRKVIEILVRRATLDLRTKLRIPIPFDAGRMMFGVVDEYGVLEYGEVFVQFTNDYSYETRTILEQEIMVTKYPCMGPGDVRKFKAVDKLQLRHFVDCIVFPQKGPRPHPNEMAGSDLDGDEYAVIWDKNLFFTGKNQKAMLYPDDPAEELDHDIDDRDILEFICKYMHEDSMGLIANAHLAWADFRPQGIFSEQCKELAVLYAQAVDFAKTGKCVFLKHEERPRRYPDFMEKSFERSTYRSERLPGKMYRKIKDFILAVSDEIDRRAVDDNSEVSLNSLLIHEEWETYRKDALKDYKLYCVRMTELLKEMALESEEQFWTTSFERKSQFNFQKKDNTDFQDHMERIAEEVFRCLRKTFESKLRPGDKAEERLKKASAYYMIMHEDKDKDNEIKKFHGFPWITSKELAELSQRNGGGTHSSEERDRLMLQKISSSADNFFTELRISGELQEYPEEMEPLQWVKVARDYLLLPWIENHPSRSLRQHSNEARKKKEKQNRKMLDSLTSCLQEVALKITFSDDNQFSVGNFIFETLKQTINSWMEGKSDRTMNQLGLAALQAMNRISKCLSISPLLPEKDLEEVSNSGQDRVKKFHIPLHSPRMEVINKGFTSRAERYPDIIANFLRKTSGVSQIGYSTHAQGRNTYWLVTAIGSKWHLDVLTKIIISPHFYEGVCKYVDRILTAKDEAGLLAAKLDNQKMLNNYHENGYEEEKVDEEVVNEVMITSGYDIDIL